MVPLEGFEYVLSILHGRMKLQLPRNYADVESHDDLQRRPKTAIYGCNEAKLRPDAASTGETLRPMPETDAAKTVFTNLSMTSF